MERPSEIPGSLTAEQWAEIEARFRAWAFRCYYRRTFKNEHEPILRFLKAMAASNQPIRDREAVLEWYRQRKEYAGDDEHNVKSD